MEVIETKVLYLPDDPALRYLPEGPIQLSEKRFSWVAIQHGADATQGSLNMFDMASGENRNWPLPGRPGFAFPTQDSDVMVVGVERKLQLFNLATGDTEDLCAEIDADVSGTIINDGLAFPGGIILGTKDLKFEEQKAGLYYWRLRDRQLIRLRDDQVCSNGKVMTPGDGNRWNLWDIDSPTQTVVHYDFDAESGALSEPTIVIDLRGEEVFPDGMVLTPDGNSVIVALYNPQDAPFGETRQYGLASGQVEAIWKTEAAAQVTCPLLMSWQGRVALILVTAAENMSPEKNQRQFNAGALFVGETSFDHGVDQVRLDFNGTS